MASDPVHEAAERVLEGCVRPTLDFGQFDPHDIEAVARVALAARADRAALEVLIERTIFALNLGGNGTLEEANQVSRDHGNLWANLYLDLCAALGRGHRAALAAPAERRGEG